MPEKFDDQIGEKRSRTSKNDQKSTPKSTLKGGLTGKVGGVCGWMVN